jgi:hypothetical protein
VTITRLSNLAEAGFFADALEHESIQSRLHQHDRFSAVDGAWSCEYFLQVDQTNAVRAAEILQKLLESAEPASSGIALTDESTPPVNWAPLAAILVAGGLAYVAGKGILERREQAAAPAQRSLWEALDRMDGELVTDAPPGEPRYRLSTSLRDDGIVFLDEDLDGDGSYELRQEYLRGEALGEAVPLPVAAERGK